MSQNPHHPGQPGGRQDPGEGRPPESGSGPAPVMTPPAPPMTRQLRWLFRLTIESLVVSVVERVPWEFGDMSVRFDANLGFVAFGVLVTAGLYALVYFGLRAQRWWCWIVGMLYLCLRTRFIMR